MLVANSESIALLDFRPRMLLIRSAVVIGIFFAVDRRHMCWIFIKIRSPNSKLLAVRVDPFPQILTRNPSLGACLTLDADEISRKPMAIAAAEASTMV